MALIQYIGGSDEVHIPTLGITATRAVPVDVPDGDAQLLLEQDIWEPVPGPEPTPTKTTTTAKGA